MFSRKKSETNSKTKQLNATNLKEAIWDVMCRLEKGKISCRAAMAHARNAEALTGVVRTQIKILQAEKDGLLNETKTGTSLKDFAE